jgi:hypothetical protein
MVSGPRFEQDICRVPGTGAIAAANSVLLLACIESKSYLMASRLYGSVHVLNPLNPELNPIC